MHPFFSSQTSLGLKGVPDPVNSRNEELQPFPNHDLWIDFQDVFHSFDNLFPDHVDVQNSNEREKTVICQKADRRETSQKVAGEWAERQVKGARVGVLSLAVG